MTIGGMSLALYRRHILTNVLPYSPISAEVQRPSLILGFGNRLWSLMTAWMSGVSAADTLCTCLAIQRPEVLQNQFLSWSVMATLSSCLLLADVMAQTHVARNDEFLPTLYSLVDGRRDPQGEAAINWWRMNQEAILKQYGEEVWNMGNKIWRWLQLVRMVRINDLNYDQMMGILAELCNLYDYENAINVSSSIEESEMFIEPKLANFFTTGCVRRIIPIPSVQETRDQWKCFLRNLTDIVRKVSEMPRFSRLLQTLLTASSESHPLSAVQRSMTFSILSRGESTVYGRMAPGRFAMEAFGLIMPDRACEHLLIDALQIASHSPSRQRRLIPKLIHAVIDAQNDAMMSEIAKQALFKMARYIGVWYVILGFHLKLYESYEVPEAHWYIMKLSEGVIRQSAQIKLEETKGLAQRSVHSVYDCNRRTHRWRCLDTLLVGQYMDVDLFEPSAASGRNEDLQTIYEQYRDLFPSNQLFSVNCQL